MKLFAILFLFMLPIQWEPDFEAAKKHAREEHKLILLNFSGSDWCGPCIAFRKDYLENDSFTKVAGDRLILVNADFPRRKKNAVSPETVKRNEALAEQYNKNGAFPLTLLLNADGKVLRSWQGKPEATAAQWVHEINTVCDANK